MSVIKIYTDGACSGNPGPGGYGVVVTENGKVIEEYQDFEENTTNNRQELKAVIWALKNYGDKNPTVYCDSAYCVNSLTNWMFTWAKNNWTKANKKPIENKDLIQLYYYLWQEEGMRIDLLKIQGHAGYVHNERADALATGKVKL